MNSATVHVGSRPVLLTAHVFGLNPVLSVLPPTHVFALATPSTVIYTLAGFPSGNLRAGRRRLCA